MVLVDARTICARCAILAAWGLSTLGCYGVELIGAVGTEGSASDGAATDGLGSTGEGDAGGATTDDDAGPSGTSLDPTAGASGSTGVTSTGGTDGDTTGGLDTTPVDDCEVRLLGQAEEITVNIMPRDPWEDGTCHDVHVRNDGEQDVFWWVQLRFGGQLYNHWNAVETVLDETAWEFRGTATANNVALLVGQETIFGTCMNCVPPGGTTGTGGSGSTGTP